MLQLQQSDSRNRLLGALAPEDFTRLAPALERWPLHLHDTLIRAHEPLSHAYFVETGLVSLVAATEGGRIEIGLVGQEGLAGVPLVLGTDRGPVLGIVQGGGEALRIPASALREALQASPGLRGVLGRYVLSLMIQMGYTVYASAELNVEARLARWILMTHDRLNAEAMPLTQEFMAMMLGVRRTGVTAALYVLSGAGMVRASEGRITVLDRDRLKDLAGDTYGPAEGEYERLLAEA
ncbi:Crp/Fnr family transcriptional regulator [Methylobacterium sp. J-072]|uniref:Crp/Fnr family transcriptional regulator n=1 Tax=Methylobacterium sp. J-072 TaxID=2836651 RepID=UPI001FBB02C4|nr:Crp/Fnr family transcriptional regulator [Methylobacterium sp. J-072]MCJ2092298.1 Crp/Fnr family transcriptional regulator [Methylobacterium sp. J-072]